MTLRSDLNGSLPSAPTTNGIGHANGETSTSRFRGQGDSSPDRDDLSNDTGDNIRPSSAPGRKNGVVFVESGDELGERSENHRVKPPLLRSKSDFAPRPVEESDTEEEISEWGARHGFEDHYQSEHIISQLASVCYVHPTLLEGCCSTLVGAS